ncbi:MAG TPA: FAD:protein FMN transferase, partial [Xanthobacteraceae bacterium]|nr:FAD:protein FMN transferase [Xanthobacteraceae bacterium]
GEVRALGRHPDGRPWRVGIRTPQAADSVRSGVAQTLDLEDAAMAVSGGYGTTFEPTGRFHHIFDPHTGESAHALLDATVVGPRATVANGLSTALCVTGEERAAALIAGCPGYRAILTRPDGTTVGFGATAA